MKERQRGLNLARLRQIVKQRRFVSFAQFKDEYFGRFNEVYLSGSVVGAGIDFHGLRCGWSQIPKDPYLPIFALASSIQDMTVSIDDAKKGLSFLLSLRVSVRVNDAIVTVKLSKLPEHNIASQDLVVIMPEAFDMEFATTANAQSIVGHIYRLSP